MLYPCLIKTRQIWQAVFSTNFDNFGKQHQHTFTDGTPIELSLSLHFCLLF